MIDIHAHVLPGIDDGPANMGDALALLQAAAEDGIRTVVASPHMLDGIYNARREDIFARVAELNDAAKEHGIAVAVLAGADVHIETEVPRLLQEHQLVTVADRGKHLMLELPQDVVPRDLDQLLFSIQLHGVTPIISHPERNRAIQDNPNELVPFVQADCLTQVTAASLLGDFGTPVQECAAALLARRLVHFVATDMHDLRHRRPKLAAAARVVRELAGANDAKEILEDNPAAVIHGGRVDPPEPVAPKPRKRWFFW